MTSLRIEDVARSYDGMQAVDGVSLELAEGEIVTLVGPSGCGKTTLLRIVAGLERPDRGSVTLGDRTLAGSPSRYRQPEDRDIGLVFQDYALFPHLTAAKNVAFGLDGLSRAGRRDRVAELLGLVGMDSLAKRYPSDLSGGEQQRVALARALATRPAVLLLDEPFSSLDRESRSRVRRDTCRVLRETRTAALLVTHDGEEAMELGDRIAVMRAGRIVQLGSADELYERPRDPFVASFFGETLRLEGVVRNGGVATALGVVPAASVPEGARALVLIRPESIRLTPVGEPPAITDADRNAPATAHVIQSRIAGGVRRTSVELQGGHRLEALHAVEHRFEDGARVVPGVRTGAALVFGLEG